MTLPSFARRGFRRAYYLLFGRQGVERTVNGQRYRFSAHVARGIPAIIREPMLQVWREMTRGARVVFEIGAHVGTYAVICAREMQPGARIYGFEPSPETYRVLCDTARLNARAGDGARIIPVNAACGEHEGVVRFVREGLKETNRLAVGAASSGNIEVQMVTVDQFCEREGVVPDVVKIDAEGAELIVLQGMRETLLQHSPAVLIELHHILWADFGVTGDQLLRIADEFGYVMYASDGTPLANSSIGGAGFCIMQRKNAELTWTPSPRHT